MEAERRSLPIIQVKDSVRVVMRRNGGVLVTIFTLAAEFNVRGGETGYNNCRSCIFIAPDLGSGLLGGGQVGARLSVNQGLVVAIDGTERDNLRTRPILGHDLHQLGDQAVDVFGFD
jgi:hypothetical protein